MRRRHSSTVNSRVDRDMQFAIQSNSVMTNSYNNRVFVITVIVNYNRVRLYFFNKVSTSCEIFETLCNKIFPVKLGYNKHGYNEFNAITNKLIDILVLNGYFTTYDFTVFTMSRL